MRSICATAIAFVASGMPAVPAWAGGEIVSWIGDDPGVWSNPLNWSGFQVPSPVDAVLITSGSLVTIDTNPTIEAFTLNGAATAVSASGRTIHVLVNDPLTCCSQVLAGQLDLIGSTWICPTDFRTAALVRVSGSNFDVGELLVLPGGHLLLIGSQAIDSPLSVLGGAPGGTVTVSQGTWLRLDPGAAHPGGFIVNDGLVQVLESGTLYIDADHILKGLGSLQLGGVNASVRGWNGDESLTNQQLVHGAGRYGHNALTLFNDPGADIVADQPSAPLIVDPSATLVNGGSLRAEGGASLQLHTGTYLATLPDSEIKAAPGSVVEFVGATIVGGVLRSEGDGRLRVVANTTTFQGPLSQTNLVLTGILEAPNDLDPRFIDAVQNLGEIRLLSAGNATIFYVDNAVTNGVQLSGGGTVAMSANLENYILGWNGGETLVNIDNLIRGSGRVGHNSIDVVNEVGGRIEADQPAPLWVDPATTLANRGVLRAVDGATMRLWPGLFDQTQGTGLTEALDDSVVELAACTVLGGTLRSQGDGVVRVVANTTSLRAPSAGQPFMLQGVLEVPNDLDPRFVDGVSNPGEIRLLSAGNATIFYVDDDATGGVQLSGGGAVAMSANLENYFLGWNGGETLVNVDNLIRGSGRVGHNSLDIVNEVAGRIEADQSAPMWIDPANTLVNRGTLRARDGATMRLFGGVFDGTDGLGLVEAVDGGVVELAGCTILGGTVRSAGTGVLRLVSNTTSIVGPSAGEPATIQGVLEVPNDLDPRLVDFVRNEGQIRLDSTGNGTLLFIDNSATDGVQLTGGGTIVMSANSENYILGWNGGETLTNIDNVIRGSGRLGHNSLNVVNHGTIAADQPVKLLVDDSSGSWTNGGQVVVAAGSLLQSADAVVQTTGVMDVDGELELLAGAVEVSGGVVKGAGLIDATVTNTGGTMAPGGSVGKLTIEGDLTQGAGATMAVEFGGYVPVTGHDVLVVDGVATLGGTLTIAFVNGFEPFPGTVFTVLSADDVVGAFDEVEGAGTFTVLYRQHTVAVLVLGVDPPCAAEDISCDGTVDGADLGLLLGAWGTADPDADINDDGTVDGADLGLLVAAWQ